MSAAPTYLHKKLVSAKQILGDVSCSRHFGGEICDNINHNKVPHRIKVDNGSSVLAHFVATATHVFLGTPVRSVWTREQVIYIMLRLILAILMAATWPALMALQSKTASLGKE